MMCHDKRQIPLKPRPAPRRPTSGSSLRSNHLPVPMSKTCHPVASINATTAAVKAPRQSAPRRDRKSWKPPPSSRQSPAKNTLHPQRFPSQHRPNPPSILSAHRVTASDPRRHPGLVENRPPNPSASAHFIAKTEAASAFAAKLTLATHPALWLDTPKVARPALRRIGRTRKDPSQRRRQDKL